MRSLLLSSVLGASLFGAPAVSPKVPQPVPVKACVRLAAADIGQLPLERTIAGHHVKVLGWEAADISATRLVGFRLESDADLLLKVQAGDRQYETVGKEWSHPRGVVGTAPITAIELCGG